MQETDIELQKKKDEKKERRRIKGIIIIALLICSLAFIVGYSTGYQSGVFVGYQFCLKQFEIINYVPGLFP